MHVEEPRTLHCKKIQYKVTSFEGDVTKVGARQFYASLNVQLVIIYRLFKIVEHYSVKYSTPSALT